MQSLIEIFYRVLGNWWAFGLLLVLSGLLFGLAVPKAKKPIFAQAKPGIPGKVLDEYIPTWTADDARAFFDAIGLEGREAYRKFYLTLDFWFPSLVTSLMYCSLLALAYPPGSRFAWLAPLGLLGWLFDNAENVTHFAMARTYSDLPSFALRQGPKFTYAKWLLAMATPLLSLPGFIGQLAAHWR